MKPNYHLRLPTAGFTFKPVAPKEKRVSNSHKHLTRILYCKAVKTEDGWKAHINTKGIEGYQDVTILDFTEKSFGLRGHNNIFYIDVDTKHWVRFIRNDVDAMFAENVSPGYYSLCPNCVFSGHIVKVDGVSQFDMSIYQGTLKECESLLTMTNKKKKDEEE